MQRQRELWVDYTKMFACILVVLGHLLQGLSKANIQWNNNLYNYINSFIYIFHMPLFMCLSGYLYKKYTKIKDWKGYFIFIKKKLINLGIPYIIFYLSYVLINIMFSNSVNSQKGVQDILNILTNPIAPYWFLYALFFIFLIIPLLERIFKNNSNTVLGVSIFLHCIRVFLYTNIYCIDIVLEYLVYFYIGVFLADKIREHYSTRNTIIITISFVIISLLYCITLEKHIINNKIMILFKFLLATMGIIASIQAFKNFTKYIEKSKILNMISKNTFPIYLMHTIFSAGIRIILLRIGVNNFYLHLICGFIIGIIGPIAVEEILEKTKYGNVILYPLKTINELKINKYDKSNDRIKNDLT